MSCITRVSVMDSMRVMSDVPCALQETSGSATCLRLRGCRFAARCTACCAARCTLTCSLQSWRPYSSSCSASSGRKGCTTPRTTRERTCGVHTSHVHTRESIPAVSMRGKGRNHASHPSLQRPSNPATLPRCHAATLPHCRHCHAAALPRTTA